MEKISIAIGRHKISLGDDISTINKYKSYNNTLFIGKDRIEIIQIPIAAYSYIEFRGKHYKDIKTLMSDNNIQTNEKIFFCGESDYLELIEESNIDISTCPFDSVSLENCCSICNSIDIYRGRDTIGFDMAQVANSHCPECILIALPDKMYITEEKSRNEEQ